MRVAQVLVDVTVPPPNPTYYNNNVTCGLSVFSGVPTIVGLNFGILASVYSQESMTQAAALAKQFSELGLFVNVVGETLMPGVNLTYSAADAVDFDGVVIASGAENIFLNGTSPLYPLGRPLEILKNAYQWGKPVGAVGSATTVFSFADIMTTPGVYLTNDTATLTADFKAGLMQFKFLDRFPLDPIAYNSSMPMSTTSMPSSTGMPSWSASMPMATGMMSSSAPMPSSTGMWHKHGKSASNGNDKSQGN